MFIRPWQPANTTSALSKITNRLNFLKERRNQIADELHDNDKDHKGHKHRGSKKWSDTTQPPDESHTQSSDKGKGSETQKEPAVDKGRSEDQSTNQGQGRTVTR